MYVVSSCNIWYLSCTDGFNAKITDFVRSWYPSKSDHWLSRHIRLTYFVKVYKLLKMKHWILEFLFNWNVIRGRNVRKFKLLRSIRATTCTHDLYDRTTVPRLGGFDIIILQVSTQYVYHVWTITEHNLIKDAHGYILLSFAVPFAGASFAVVQLVFGNG